MFYTSCLALYKCLKITCKENCVVVKPKGEFKAVGTFMKPDKTETSLSSVNKKVAVMIYAQIAGRVFTFIQK